MVKTTNDFINERKSEGQNVGVINLGCARNLVDSQTILSNLKREGHKITNVNQSDIAVVNTCSFIDEAKQESIDTIIDLLELKKQGKLKKVIVAGCLAQRYHKELAEEFTDIDAIIGAQKLDSHAIPSNVSMTPKHYAYVKISESCYNHCNFCVIPKLKGKFVSRTIESVIEEIKILDKQGISEVNLIGQDITAYGMDLYKELSLAKLLKEVVKECHNIQWVRLLYAFPAHVTDELIDVIGSHDKICNYIDIPLQHISDHILAGQNRNITTEGTKVLMQKFRDKVKGGSLRTAFICGLPGETEEDFEELLEFIEQTQFDKAGAFVYSHEEGTPSYDMDNQVPDEVKRERMNRLMNKQQEISRKKQETAIGSDLRVMIDEMQKGEENMYIARSEYDAPDVDGVIYVHSKDPLAPGNFVNVRITDAYEYDLAGEVI
ncbi:MAG: ribosomal protein S12 methylthiotransferase [Candidatus Omnitrophota bacterium]|jgi:ribosomal protein S12 methylthiotransferase